MTVDIPLSRGLVALVDDEDADRVRALGKWYAHKDDTTFYARKNFWRNGRCLSIRMHQIIVDARLVDHINGDGLDNRRSNLRPASTRQNSQNRGMRSDNTSGYKGVYWHKATGRWAASISSQSGRLHLGLYDSAITAAMAYDVAALHYFGEFARLNFTQEKAS